MKKTPFLSLILMGALAVIATSGPIPPGPSGNFVNNSAAPQNAQLNVGTATVRGALTVGNLQAGTLTVSGTTTGSFTGSGAGLTNIPWSGVLKTGSSLSDLTAKDHSVLTSTGTNSHAAIDGHIAATAAHGATNSNTANRIVARDGAGAFSAGAVTAASFIGPLAGNALTASIAASVAGGSLGTLLYQSVANTTAALPAGPYNYLLQGRGADVPVWTSSPTILGTNITAVPLAALNSGTLPTSIPASSITASGVTPGVYGGPTQSAQITVGSDGRIRTAIQTSMIQDPAINAHFASLDVATATLTTNLAAEVVRATVRENALGISTGSVYSALQSTGAALTAETARAVVMENALGISTGTIAGNLASEISRAGNAENALGVSTGALQTSLSAVILSTGVIQTSLAAEINRATAQENALGVSTGTIKSSLDAVILSTGSIYSALQSTGSALMAETNSRVSSDNAILATISTAAYLASSQTLTGLNIFSSPVGINATATGALTVQSTSTYALTPILELHDNSGADVLHVHQDKSAVFSGTITAVGLTATSSVTAYNVTVSSTVCFPDGSCMSAAASGTGGITSGSTTTWTGSNTFTNVTASSFTATNATIGSMANSFYSTATVSMTVSGMTDNTAVSFTFARAGKIVTMGIPATANRTKNASVGTWSFSGIPTEYRPTNNTILALMGQINYTVGVYYSQADTAGVFQMWGAVAGNSIAANQAGCALLETSLTWMIK